MSIEGVSKDWAGVIEDQTPKLLKLVVAVCKRIPAGQPDEKEDDITKRLCLALQRSRTARELMFYVHPQIVELDPATGDEFGRMDIGFFPTNQPWVPSEDIYFCLECKRLNVVKDGKPPRSYAPEYVKLGVARFVTGQYARAVRHGCMVGYVRDGEVAKAMGNVEEHLVKNREGLGMEPPGGWLVNGFLPRTATARETHHKRSHDYGVFRLHHLFMPSGAKV